MDRTLRDKFVSLLERYVSALTFRGDRATGLCPFHPDRHPSFSANLERCVWFCFPCGRGGGVKAFAAAVGEAWENTRSESRAAKAYRARFHAERQARAILTKRAEKRHAELCAQHRAAHVGALAAAELLGLFHRRPDLAEEFAELVARTERDYGEVLFRLTMLAAKLDGDAEA